MPRPRTCSFCGGIAKEDHQCDVFLDTLASLPPKPRPQDISTEVARLRGELDALKQAFKQHWEWHKHNEGSTQKAVTNFFKQCGTMYAIARSREDARRDDYEFGPTPDLIAARDSPDSDDNRVLVEFQDSAVNGRVVAEYLHGCWHDLDVPEDL